MEQQYYLDFEETIAKLEAQIKELKSLESEDLSVSQDIEKLTQKLHEHIQKTYDNLTPHQVVQVSRHPNRPHATTYIKAICSEFHPLSGDRQFADDQAIIGGLARFEDQTIMVIGHEKGFTTEERIAHNFGMPNPEGYRKAWRLMQLAERFNIPIVTLIDTPGAYPGTEAEKRNQSGAIAENLVLMSGLKVPIISIVIGEGGSAGALAIGVCDKLMMLEYSIYSVISPEGCASILWKDAKKAFMASESMCITSQDLEKQNLVDEIIKEPIGGAHRNWSIAANNLKQALSESLASLKGMSQTKIVEERRKRWLNLTR